MKRAHFEVGQTAASIVADEEYHAVAKRAIFEARHDVESKIAEDPFFGATYDPYPPSPSDPPVVRRMCAASVLAGVGPMAGVAGAVAAAAVEAMAEAGSAYSIVENGGDIALRCDRDAAVGLYPGDGGLDGLALLVPGDSRTIGVCSSSGVVGPSVSLGSSGICTVVSADPVLADCCATRLGNMVAPGRDMAPALEEVCRIEGVRGCLAYCGGMLAACGDLPELVRAEPGARPAGLLYLRRIGGGRAARS